MPPLLYPCPFPVEEKPRAYRNSPVELGGHLSAHLNAWALSSLLEAPLLFLSQLRAFLPPCSHSEGRDVFLSCVPAHNCRVVCIYYYVIKCVLYTGLLNTSSSLIAFLLPTSIFRAPSAKHCRRCREAASRNQAEWMPCLCSIRSKRAGTVSVLSFLHPVVFCGLVVGASQMSVA